MDKLNIEVDLKLETDENIIAIFSLLDIINDRLCKMLYSEYRDLIESALPSD